MVNNVANRKYELANDRAAYINKMINKVSNRIEQVNRVGPSPRGQAVGGAAGLKSITSQDHLVSVSSQTGVTPRRKVNAANKIYQDFYNE